MTSYVRYAAPFTLGDHGALYNAEGEYMGMLTVPLGTAPGDARVLREHVVKACNAHDELVAALRYTLDCMERGDTSDMQPVRDALAKVTP